MFSKKLFLCQKNVHPILDLLTRRGKFILSFWTFIYFSTNFSAKRIEKKLRAARPGRGPAERQAAGPPRRPLLLAHGTRRRRRVHGGHGSPFFNRSSVFLFRRIFLR